MHKNIHLKREIEQENFKNKTIKAPSLLELLAKYSFNFYTSIIQYGTQICKISIILIHTKKKDLF